MNTKDDDGEKQIEAGFSLKFWVKKIKEAIVAALVSKKIIALIIASFLGLFITLFVNWRQHVGNLESEKRRLRAEILLKVVEGQNIAETKKRMIFFMDTKILQDDEDSTLRKIANTPDLLPSFNVDSPIPTVTITNASLNPCNKGEIDGCWQTSVLGRPGDVIAVQIFFSNTSNIPSMDTKIFIRPRRTTVFNQLVFSGGVSSSTVNKSISETTLKITSSKLHGVAPMLNQAKWYSSLEQDDGHVVNENDLYDERSGGFSVGTIPPWGQGVLIAKFLISN